jgi:outer membrane protein insertion porin family
MKKFLVLLLMSVLSVVASTVKEIRFESLIHISSEVAKEMIKIKEGDELDIEKVDSSIKILFKQGYFKDIWVTEESGVLTFHFREKPVIAKVDITGFGSGKEDEVLEAINIHKGDIYDIKKIEAAKKQIIKYLEQDGFFDSIVEAKTEELNPGSLKLDLIVSKGENIIIKKINLCGAKKLDYDDFEPYIANKEKEFLGWLWGRNDGKLKVNELELDSFRIKDLYMKEGYLDATVSTPYLRAFYDGYFADLTYMISEGKVYRIRSIDIKLSEPVIKVQKLKEDMRVRVGKIFNIDKLRDDLKSIEKKIADLGYAYVRVYPDIKKDKKNAKADIIINVIPGQKVYINEVRISGNTRTIDRVIRREMYLSAGDLYSYTDLKDSTNALRRTGYFDSVTITKKKVADNRIDLLVKVEEAHTGSIIGGIGYGSYDGLLLNASVSDKNVFGSGIEVGLDLDYSSKTTKGSLYFANPRVFDSIYSLSGSIFNKTYELYEYDEDKKGLNLTIGRKFGRFIRGSISYELQESELSNVSDTLDTELYRIGKTIKSSITPSVSYNSTDDYFLPRSGILASASFEFAGLGGDEKFLKNYYSFSYFYGLEDIIDYDLILRYKAKLSLAVDNGYLPVNEKFYMGGMKSVRGYKSGSLSPKNSSGDLVGGNRMFANSVEASIPLIKSAKMRMLFFLDYGMIGEDSFDINRAGTGTGIEWISPLGPIQLIYAFPIGSEEDDQTSSFEFTLGRRF